MGTMGVKGACPDERLLLRVTLGERSEDELALLEAHLDTCADCRRIVAAAASEETLPASDSFPAIQVGALVGRYVVEGILGVGGMGIVYAARDPSLGRAVALKLLRTGHDGASNARLEREARTMAQLSHPNLVPVFELGTWEGRVFLAMEFIDGVALDDWSKAHPRSTSEVLQTLIEAGRGLAAAHAAGVVHRDFKPGNVLIGRDGRVRVTDFGLARMQPNEGAAVVPGMTVTQAGALLGTLAYMSPEQLAGEVVDARSDQFSFCVTLAEALGGTRPFPAKNQAALQVALRGAPQLSRVPSRFRRVLAQGLSFNRDARFASMEALFQALRRAQRRPRVVGAALVLLALAPVGVLAWNLRTRAAVQQPQDMTTVLVVGFDLEEGTVLTSSMLEERDVPERWVTSSIIRPDAARFVVGQKLNVPMQKGDFLLWTAFETIKKK